MVSKIEAKIGDFVKQTAEYTDKLKGEPRKMGRIILKNGEPHRSRTCNLLIKSHAHELVC